MTMPPGPEDSPPGAGPYPEQPPGWYPDPFAAGGTRWWDGQSWGAPAPGMGPQPGGGYRPFVGPNIAEEQTSGKRAMTALWVGAAAYATSAVAQAFTISVVVDQFNQALSQASTPRGTRVRSLTPNYPAWYFPLSALTQVAGIASLVVGVIFLLWFHRAVSNARALGIPQRRSPGWAIGGWFIPFGNFFLPYQSAVDLFPADSPDRKLVNRWWALYLSASLGTVLVFIGAIIATAIAVAIAAAIAVLWIFAAIAARAMIKQAMQVHADMAQISGASGSGYGQGYGSSYGPSAGPTPGPGNAPGPYPGGDFGPGPVVRDPWNNNG